MVVLNKTYLRENYIPYCGKEVEFMGYFLAVNDKQLGLCLRMLYADGLSANVQTLRNDKGKIEFHISTEADEDYFNELLERYTILIS